MPGEGLVFPGRAKEKLMQGYETKQQRETHIRALAIELGDIKRAVMIAEAKLAEVPEGKRIERAAREQDLENLTVRVELVEEQLRVFRGEAPHKRATKRADTSPGEQRGG
jgi:hypothetical protein